MPSTQQPNSSQKRIYLICAYCIFLLFAHCGCERVSPSGDGKSIENFRLQTLDHQRFYLNEHRGKVVLLLFWATYCRQCKTEMLAVKDMLPSLPSEHFSTAAICIDPENLSTVKRIVDGLHISYPVLLDHKAGLYKRLGLQTLPTAIVLDTDGTVAMKVQGFNQQIGKKIFAKIHLLLTAGAS